MFLSRQIGLFAKNLQGLSNQTQNELGFPPRCLPEPEPYPPLKAVQNCFLWSLNALDPMY